MTSTATGEPFLLYAQRKEWDRLVLLLRSEQPEPTSLPGELLDRAVRATQRAAVDAILALVPELADDVLPLSNVTPLVLATEMLCEASGGELATTSVDWNGDGVVDEDDEMDEDAMAAAYVSPWELEDICKVLLRAGADPDTRTANGESVLLLAVRAEIESYANFLIQRGAEVERGDAVCRVVEELDLRAVRFVLADMGVMDLPAAKGTQAPAAAPAAGAPAYPDLSGELRTAEVRIGELEHALEQMTRERDIYKDDLEDEEARGRYLGDELKKAEASLEELKDARTLRIDLQAAKAAVGERDARIATLNRKVSQAREEAERSRAEAELARAEGGTRDSADVQQLRAMFDILREENHALRADIRQEQKQVERLRNSSVPSDGPDVDELRRVVREMERLQAETAAEVQAEREHISHLRQVASELEAKADEEASARQGKASRGGGQGASAGGGGGGSGGSGTVAAGGLKFGKSGGSDAPPPGMQLVACIKEWHVFPPDRDIIIGRGRKFGGALPDVLLPSDMENTSKHHALIEFDDTSGRFVLANMSKYGTVVDDQELSDRGAAPLADGSKFVIGSRLFAFRYLFREIPHDAGEDDL